VGVSIGMAFYPQDGDTMDALLSAADSAMYDVKHAGKGGLRHAGSGSMEQS
jgi:GGDEF domain-containing protein